MRTPKTAVGVIAAALGGWVLSAHAGVLDTPLPTFADGKPAMLVGTATAVKDNELETIVICTNVADAPVDVGVEFFDETGVVRNTVAAGDGGVLAVTPGATVTVASGSTAALHEDTVAALNTAGNTINRLSNGALRVVATDPRVGCAAYAVDRFHVIADPAVCPQCPPPSIAVLPIVGVCSPAACDDGDPCTVDGCGSGACTHTAAADGTPCDDADLCTTGDTCTSGVCAGTAVVCNGDTPCNLAMQCDPATGQCVQSTARSICIPGGGDAETDCALEWVVDNPGNPGGVTSATQICRQGDASCDVDTNAKRCTFRVRVCLAMHDANLPSCVPSALSSVTLLKPRPSASIRPLLNATEVLAPSSRSGKGGKRITFTPAITTTDECTREIQVAVKLAKATTLKTAAVVANGTDKDRIRLQCVRKLPGGN